MRFPWQRRADEERRHRLAAEKRAEDARSDWTRIAHHLAPVRRERELNGWTGIANSLFSNKKAGS